MRIIFRADASLNMGTGHVMRSSALAETAISRGFECVFIGNVGNISWLEDRVRGLGFSEILSNSSEYISKASDEILILDSYEINPHDPFIGISNWKYVVSIADPSTPKYNSNLIVHSGLDISWIKESSVPVLFGANYILIRKTIWRNVKTIPSSSEILNILLVGGGSDPFEFCKMMASILDEFDYQFEVKIMSKTNIQSKTGKKFRVYPVGPEMDKLISEVDLVITTAGTSCLEFIAREIPIGVVSVAANQKLNYKELSERKLVQPLGYLNNETDWQIDIPSLEVLIRSHALRLSLSNNCRNVIDLKGPDRVLDYILNQVNRNAG
jgi:UDP-2,4-diacetamido-2,4,6-trideoxy-beta-L-altropyranose hydrolase